MELTKLFDNVNDPYQMNNLVGNPEYASLQKKLYGELNSALKAIGDELRPREYYLNKWDYVLDEKKGCIDYSSFLEGKGVVQTPESKYY